ncbi:MAG: carbamoyltransferase [Thalassospira sp.]|uniref:carbamoyltransferase family protein n=1 Tax=Thalassospira sp. TaxID=1912094 RepID=UPI003A8B7BD7
MYVLGVSFDYHDAAAALIHDGKVICAIQEERLSRIKHDPVLPEKAIQACLARADISAQDLDMVVFYEDLQLKFDRICRETVLGLPYTIKNFAKALKSWRETNKFEPELRIASYLDIPSSKVRRGNHHLSHAASAFYASDFGEATVVTLDGVGEYETATVYRANGQGLQKISSTTFPNSIGLFYSAFTAYLGFEVNEGEYKVMGMAAFGVPRYYEKIRRLIRVKKGKIIVDQDYFTFRNPREMPFSPKLIDLLGAARIPDSPISLSAVESEVEDDPEAIRYVDIAASLQKVAEEVIIEFISHAIAKTGIKDLCFAGGVALNSLANGRIQSELEGRVYIHPSPGDSGGALGAALEAYYKNHSPLGRKLQKNPYLGISYDQDEVLAALRDYADEDVIVCENDDDMISRVAKLIGEGNVLGWFQGRFEWGPRALGARSIIASPTFKDMKDRVNRQIKFREPFRPFAPSVAIDHAYEYFDLPDNDYVGRPEDYMLSVCGVRKRYQPVIPAIVHADGTARVQTVRPEISPLYYRLLKAVGDITGVSVLMNTSFNLKGEPIVSTPRDALQTFEWSEMDFLVMGNVIVSRPDPLKIFMSAKENIKTSEVCK